MSKQLKVLVAGATGQQGSAVADALLARGHRVRGLTRQPSAQPAARLAARGADVVAGDFSDPGSLVRAASGVDTAFLMSTPFESGEAAETAQGIAAIDALKAGGVGHLIYSSVASADRSTGIPHFESKVPVERHLAASGVPYTIVAPVTFMENAAAPWSLAALAQGRFEFGLAPATRLQVISVADIGAIVASLAERRSAVFGRRIDLAGDELTGEEMAAAIADASGREIRYSAMPIEAVRQQSEDFALMFEWFNRTGYSADIAGLRSEFPDVEWTSYRAWAKNIDWSMLDRTPVSQMDAAE